MPRPELGGAKILVTRPQAQSEWLAEAIQQLGGIPLTLPMLEIQPVPLDAGAWAKLAELSRFNIVIFISANAVEYALQCKFTLPSSVKVGVVGQASAARLQAAGIAVDLIPARFDSEGLLALPALQSLQDSAVLIVRGKGGREKLADVLRRRGASVEYVELYRRQCPDWHQADLATALQADVISLTSSEALNNLAKLAQLPGGASLWLKPLVVYHSRIAGRAQELGFTLKPIVAGQASDEAMVTALRQWANEYLDTEQV